VSSAAPPAGKVKKVTRWPPDRTHVTVGRPCARGASLGHVGSAAADPDGLVACEGCGQPTSGFGHAPSPGLQRAVGGYGNRAQIGDFTALRIEDDMPDLYLGLGLQ
jgi:hypothetical protein